MFPPRKKSGMGAMLGIAPKGPREEPPPVFGGTEAPAEEMAESQGGCMCPACGAPLQLVAAEVPEEAAESEPREQVG